MSEQQRPSPNKDWQDLPPIDAFLDHDDDALDSACSLKDPSLCFIKDHIDLHSAMYHQHVLTANRSMSSSPKKNINLSKLSESSNSKSKLKPTSGTGTITVVTKTTTTTTITGFPVVDVLSRQCDTMAEHVAQKAPSPNNSCSSSESSSSSNDDNDDDMLNNDSKSEATPFSASSTNKNYKFSCSSYQRNGSYSTSNHSQAVSQSRTPKISKSKPKKKAAMATNKRTTTSYDAKTTAYLKKAFFNYYSKQYKLTREQREVVIRETGLHSRNVTYWFSNHKRRLGAELAIYRKLTKEHKIKDYDAFIQWRQDQALPAHITREEIRLYKESH